jgi:hypothetical protein
MSPPIAIFQLNFPGSLGLKADRLSISVTTLTVEDHVRQRNHQTALAEWSLTKRRKEIGPTGHRKIQEDLPIDGSGIEIRGRENQIALTHLRKHCDLKVDLRVQASVKRELLIQGLS